MVSLSQFLLFLQTKRNNLIYQHMKTRLLFWIIPALFLTGCSKNDLGEMFQKPNQDGKDDVKNNVEKVFGVTFDANHDWCTTASGEVTISGIPSGTTKVQLYALISQDVKDDENQDAVVTSLLKLNEDEDVAGSQVTLVYDAPSLNKGIYAAIECDGMRFMKLVNNGSANFANSNRKAARRAPSADSFASMTLTEEVESFASQRGWLPGQKLYGMSDEVVHAIAAHHDDIEPTTPEAIIVKICDAMSAARPGARNISAENFAERMRDLENIATSFPGIDKAYAISAGREIRVIVEPKQIDDLSALKLARDIANKIEATMSYPGVIKVNVIRETRAVEYAK